MASSVVTSLVALMEDEAEIAENTEPVHTILGKDMENLTNRNTVAHSYKVKGI